MKIIEIAARPEFNESALGDRLVRAKKHFNHVFSDWVKSTNLGTWDGEKLTIQYDEKQDGLEQLQEWETIVKNKLEQLKKMYI